MDRRVYVKSLLNLGSLLSHTKSATSSMLRFSALSSLSLLSCSFALGCPRSRVLPPLRVRTDLGATLSELQLSGPAAEVCTNSNTRRARRESSSLAMHLPVQALHTHAIQWSRKRVTIIN